VIENLRDEFVQNGRAEHFERQNFPARSIGRAVCRAGARNEHIGRGAQSSYSSAAKRYRELFRQEIADTVADPGEVEFELRFLAAALARK
jgi:hypothetical protein